jgi:hypothetical protein
MPRSPAQLARHLRRLRRRQALASRRHNPLPLESHVELDVATLEDPHWTVERVREILEDYGLRAGSEASCTRYVERGGRLCWCEPGH